jgi:quercetin dioxygenase-like cupin family protein
MAESIVRNIGDGERMWFLGGGTHTWKALAEETDDSMLVFEDELERGKVTPMHLHPDVDEALYIIEGEILLNVEGEERTVGAGGFTFAPRGCAHAFVVTSERARLL